MGVEGYLEELRVVHGCRQTNVDLAEKSLLEVPEQDVPVRRAGKRHNHLVVFRVERRRNHFVRVDVVFLLRAFRQSAHMFGRVHFPNRDDSLILLAGLLFANGEAVAVGRDVDVRDALGVILA